MSYTLAPIAVTIPTDTTGLIPGQQIAVSIPGELTTVTWVKIANESPCGLQVRNITSGTDWIAPYSVDVYPVDGLNSSLQLSPYNILGVAAAQTPVSFLIVTWYSAGERPAGTYPVSLQRLTNVGNALTTSTSAANAFEQDFLSAFVLTGLISTKDGSVANQLDTTSGIAFLVQTDSSLGRVAPLASVHLTSAISSTYFLDLNPDGSFSFATTHSAVPNHLTLATVATDGSGNISTVTDNRTLSSTMLAAMGGLLTLPKLASLNSDNGAITSDGIGNETVISLLTAHADLSAQQLSFDRVPINGEAANTTFIFGAADGAGKVSLFLETTQIIYLRPGSLGAIVGQFGTGIVLTPDGGIDIQNGGLTMSGALMQVGGQASAGSFGVPVIVAQALRVHVTATTLQTILSFTVPSSGVYRVSGDAMMQDSTARALQFSVSWTNPDTSGANAQWLQSVAGSTIQVFNTTNLWAPGVDYAALPLTLAAKGGTTLTVIYQHGAGTPNDFVTAIVERLA